MERSNRPTAIPPAKREQAPPPPPFDFGNSADPARRCKTCACHLEVKNPQKIGDSQSVCRRNGVNMMMQTRQGIAGPQQEMTLSYPLTQPDLVCFDGWRPESATPGANWKQEQMAKAITPLLEQALKQAGINGKLAADIGRAMCDGAVAAGQFGLGGDKAPE